MKNYIYAVAFCALLSLSANAQTANSTDSNASNNVVRELEQRRDEVKAQIKQEDAKRNRQIAGVSAESMERINLEQDSVCLALRSELVEIELQISEASKDTPEVIDYNSLIEQATSAIEKKQPTTSGNGAKKAD